MKRKVIGSTFTMISIALVLSGCATMSEGECVTGDWHSIGFEDGASGRTMDRLSRYREACAKYGITADAKAYRAGRDEGLYEYCTADRGYRVGLAGQNYKDVCPADLEPDFVGAYRVGHHLYTLRSDVSSLESELHAKEDALKDTEQQIELQESRLLSDDITKEERATLLGKIKDLSEDKGEIELEIKQLIDERARRQYEVTLYEQQIADYGYQR